MQHPIRLVLREQGRSVNWLARQVGISPNYLQRILAGDSREWGRPTPVDFYERVSKVLQVPPTMLHPAEPAREVAA